jgi:hypothetical protein
MRHVTAPALVQARDVGIFIDQAGGHEHLTRLTAGPVGQRDPGTALRQRARS